MCIRDRRSTAAAAAAAAALRCCRVGRYRRRRRRRRCWLGEGGGGRRGKGNEDLALAVCRTRAPRVERRWGADRNVIGRQRRC
eukprot:11467642-Alexandrium_andersonii.AAC.1